MIKSIIFIFAAFLYSTSPKITDSRITLNVAEAAGGGIYCNHSSPGVEDYFIAANTGSGIQCRYSSPIINTCIISGNSGGGIRFRFLGESVINTIIADNTAEYGGGFYFLSSPSAMISNCTITGNSALQGGAAYCNSSSTSFTNSILWPNAPYEVFVRSGDPPSIHYSDVYGGWPGQGNIDADPDFISYLGFDYLLRPGSPCIDAGNPSVEDGIEWPSWYSNDPRADIGAYGGPFNSGWKTWK